LIEFVKLINSYKYNHKAIITISLEQWSVWVGFGFKETDPTQSEFNIWDPYPTILLLDLSGFGFIRIG